MPAITSDKNITINRDYSDNFAIKETVMNTLGTKYFGDVELSALNVGALGFTLEQVSNITEDGFNTASVMLNEAFPNKAIMPESIYSHAAVFQLSNAFTPCGNCSFILLLQQSDILQYGETDGNNIIYYIDKRTVINVEDTPFTLDYDIQIKAHKKFTDNGYTYDYAAQYVIDSSNSISAINDPYLKIRNVSNGYLLLMITAHQVERTEITDSIINNSKINYPVLEYEFEDGLAGFDIFYKEPSSNTYVQLEKRVKFSLPLKNPFCYYKLKDDQTLEITFSTKDGYFQPKFNSEIRIVLYTTLGKEGNFESYTGTNVTFLMNSEKYPYNSSMIIAAKPTSACTGGDTRATLEELQALTVESFATANELSDENDIMTYYYNYKYRYNNEILVIKRRDDITERLFSAFLLLKNGDYIYPTNTMFLDISESQFDETDTNQFILKPGHVFAYKNQNINDNTLKIIPDTMAYEKDKVQELMDEYDFLYTNPFLISINKIPNAVGLYKNIVSQSCGLDFISADSSLFTQFITSKINIQRGLDELSAYNMSMSIIPSASLSDDELNTKYINTFGGIDNNYVRVIVGFIGNGGDERGYIELHPEYNNPDDPSNVTFSASLTTNDIIKSTNEFSITNAVKSHAYIKSDYVTIPASDASVNVYIFYRIGGTNSNKFTSYEEFDGIEEFALVNTYQTRNDKLTFIEPLNMMRSTATFNSIINNNKPELGVSLSFLPVIKASTVCDTDSFNLFIDNLTMNYRHLEESLSALRNNTHIDIKFYNTYGMSKNYYVGDDDELIDRVNISIKFKVFVVNGTDDIEIRKNLKDFIKKFIENVNSSGTNELYISNLIKEIETAFTSIHHLKFMGINDYPTDYQTIGLKVVNLNELTKNERRLYVPEILVVNTDDIDIIIDIEKKS